MICEVVLFVSHHTSNTVHNIYMSFETSWHKWDIVLVLTFFMQENWIPLCICLFALFCNLLTIEMKYLITLHAAFYRCWSTLDPSFTLVKFCLVGIDRDIPLSVILASQLEQWKLDAECRICFWFSSNYVEEDSLFNVIKMEM